MINKEINHDTSNPANTKKSLSLSPIERAELVEMAFDSFGSSQKHNFDRLWVNEAESRIDAFEEGKFN